MSAREPRGKISLPLFDSLLFSTEEERQDAKLEKVQNISIQELHAFTDHPYQVKDDEEMQKMVESVKQYGVLTPLIARPRTEGGYEIIAGHRRTHACGLAGMDTLPVIVREMDDDTAVILLVDSNCQRENVSPIEKAKAYKMKLEAMNRQGQRVESTFSQVGKKLNSYEEMAEKTGESRNQIHRYIRLNDLIPELQDMVEEKKLKFNPAVELSYLSSDEQEQFLDFIKSEECTPSLSQAQKLKAASREKSLDEKSLKKIMTDRAPSVKPHEQQISIPLSKLEKFFPNMTSTEQIISQILRILDAYQRNRQRGGQERGER